jgi:hypothetical protein
MKLETDQARAFHVDDRIALTGSHNSIYARKFEDCVYK